MNNLNNHVVKAYFNIVNNNIVSDNIVSDSIVNDNIHIILNNPVF